jgi:glutamate/tyrosine decarboxylase-like PLP-dependent enzyme
MMTPDDKLLFQKAQEYAFSYMETVTERPVFPSDKALDNLKNFHEPLPESPCHGAEVLEKLHRYGSPATVAQTGGRYFGFVNGGSIPAVQASQWITTAWDQNAALYLMSPIASCLETICLQWLIELFELPEQCVAGLLSGSSVATLCGLAAARHVLLEKQGWDVNADGLSGAPRIRVVLGEQAHSSVFKALSILGFGRNQLELVPADEQGRMRIDRLPQLDDRTMLIVQAGNVNTGAFDNIDSIADRANKAGTWLHVDGAFGLWCAASGSRKHLTRGIDKADSWSVDAHKTLNAPYDCGIILCKHPQALTMAMQASGSYIHYSKERDGMAYVPEMSRRARSVELWATLKTLGRTGIENLIDSLHQYAS